MTTQAAETTGTSLPRAASESREFVGSLARGLSVIRAFGNETPALTLSEVAERTGLTRAAARRFLLTLKALGYVQSDGKLFRLTARVLDLGYAYLSSMSLIEQVQPFMEEVRDTLNESCSLSVLEGCDVVYIARVPTRRIMSVELSVGSRLPAFCTSMGRVLLSGHDDAGLADYIAKTEMKPYTAKTVTDPQRLTEIVRKVRKDGYALVDQELEEGLRSMAVPLANARGEILAAMNVSGHSSRVSHEEMIERYLPVLRDATRRAARMLR